MLSVELPCLLICAALFLAVSSADIESKHGGAWNLFMDRVRIKEGSSNVPVLGGLLDSFGGLDSRRLSTVLQTLPLPSVLSQRSLSPRPVSAPLPLSSLSLSPPIPVHSGPARTALTDTYIFRAGLPHKLRGRQYADLAGPRRQRVRVHEGLGQRGPSRLALAGALVRCPVAAGHRGRRSKRRAGQDLSFVCLLVCWGPVLFVLTFSFRFPP